MKNVENSGVSKECLERGYEYTGDVIEIGDNVFKPESIMHEKHEAKMAKMFGLHAEDESGGFLERNNYDDRI
jgi:hypothetical protein